MNKNTTQGTQGVRLHFSSVITATLKGVGALIIIFLFNFSDFISALQTGGENVLHLWISSLVLIAIIALVFLFNLMRWLRTYTYFEDSSFVISRQLITQNKTTVKLSSIASVNLKQSIFDHIFGTYTLQLDINSTVNANKTDFNLVFSKAYALELKKMITGFLEKSTSFAEAETEEKHLIHHFPFSRVVRHGFLSIPIVSILISLGLIFGFVVDIMIAEPQENSLSSFLIAAIFFGQLFIALLSPFFKYYNFSISRQNNRVIVSHGLISKSEYTLPLSKTNAIILRQPLLARLFGLYYGEILNIGMGDEEKKSAPIFCLICDPEELHSILSQIAPEFIITAMPERSPLSALLPVSFKYGSFAAFSLVLSTILGSWIIGVIAFLFFFLCGFLSWRTKEISLQETKLSITTGIFTRRIITVPYSRLQNISIKSGPISTSLGLSKGQAVILSEMSNRNNTIGYFPVERFDVIMEKMIEQRGSAQ